MYQTGSQYCQSLSMALKYQNRNSGIRLVYDMVGKSNLQTFCSCGSKFDIQHSMSCKKGGFKTAKTILEV